MLDSRRSRSARRTSLGILDRVVVAPKEVVFMAVTTQARPESRATTTKKWVYLFEEGNKDMRDLLGGKGAGVAEMTRAGLPVPPGFTITTEACNAYYASGKKLPDGMWDQAIEALHHVEEKTGKRLGDPSHPLLVSVRSGAKFSMPGMMDTVLNLGLNPQTLEGLAKLTNDRRFGLDAYRRFIQMFGNMGADAGTGVAFTRDPNTAEKVLYGDYLPNAQGEDVVAGIRTPLPISAMKKQLPDIYREFETNAERLEKHYRDVQDLEFTVEKRKLWMLQTRSAKRTAQAAVKIAVDMVNEK